MTKRPKMDVPTAIDLLGPARKTREAVAHFQPMVLYAPRRGQAVMAIVDGEGSLASLVSSLLMEMRTRLGPAEWISVTTDAYMQNAKHAAEGPDALATAFAEGDPTVVEQMIVVLRHRYKPAEMASQTYRYLPSEGYEWDDAEVIKETEGDILAVLDYYIV